VHVPDGVAPDEPVLAWHQIRVLILIYDFHVIEVEVETLVDGGEGAGDLDVVLEFEDHFGAARVLLGELFEEGPEELQGTVIKAGWGLTMFEYWIL
jgi:hypothetical protein